MKFLDPTGTKNGVWTPILENIDDEMADVPRQKTEGERFRIGFCMWKTARAILGAAIRSDNPDWDVHQVNREIADRISHGVVRGEPDYYWVCKITWPLWLLLCNSLPGE